MVVVVVVVQGFSQLQIMLLKETCGQSREALRQRRSQRGGHAQRAASSRDASTERQAPERQAKRRQESAQNILECDAVVFQPLASLSLPCLVCVALPPLNLPGSLNSPVASCLPWPPLASLASLASLATRASLDSCLSAPLAVFASCLPCLLIEFYPQASNKGL